MTSLPAPDSIQFPNDRGTYVLILRLDRKRSIQIGKLGLFQFPAGYYLYVGSALGSGGLAGRLGRHITLNQATTSPHWHIDYLHRWASIMAVWFSQHESRREHDWAALIEQLAGCNYPAPGFGASDCRCRAHLFHFAQPPVAGQFAALLNHALPDDEPMQIIEIESNRRAAESEQR